MNIIFDVGGVILRWEPKRFIEHVLDRDDDRKIAYSKIIQSNAWLELNRGSIDYDDMVDISAKESGMDIGKVRKLISTLPNFLTPITETLDLIYLLKNSNHKLYILSNMPGFAADILEVNFSFWNLFDGIVFSGRIGMLKPEEKIYRYILDRYNLDPEDTIFIDDTLENVEAASRIGINGIHFVNPSEIKEKVLSLM